MKQLEKKIADFLAHWGKRLKTDVTYLAHSGFWLSIGQVATSLSSLALTIAFANILPKEAYGDYRYILSVAGILSVFTVSGLGDAVMRASAQGNDGTIFPATRERVKVAVVGAVVGIGIAIYYYVRGATLLGTGILFASLLLPFFDTFTLFIPFLQGKEDFKLSTWYATLIHVISSVIMLAVVFLAREHVEWLVLTYFGAYALFRYIYYKKVTRKIAANAPEDRDSLIYGRHLSINGVLSMIASQIDNVLVFSRLGGSDLATYSIGLAGPNQVKGPIGNLDTIVAARFAKRDVEDIATSMNRKLFLTGVVSVIMTVGYIVLVPFVYHFVFPQYHDSIIYSQIFALSLLGTTFLPIDSFLTAHRRIKERYIINIFYSIARIVGVVVGILLGGLIGLVISRVVVGFMTNILQYVLYRSIVKTL